MTLKRFGLFFISTLISTTGIYWWQRNTPDVKGEDFAAIYDVARQQAWSKLSDSEMIAAGNHLKTTTVTRVDVSRDLVSQLSDLLRGDVVLGGNGQAVSLDAISSAAFSNGFNLASIVSAPWPVTNGVNNRFNYNYAAVGPYSTNGVPAAEHLWSLGSARSDGSRPFGYDDLFTSIPTNRCPILNTYIFPGNLVTYRTAATNSTSRPGGAIWPTNTQANFLWTYERKFPLMSCPLRTDKNYALDVVNVTSNIHLSATNQTVNFTLMIATNRVEIIPQSETFAITNTYLVTSNTLQRYAQFNVGSKGAQSWINNYATLSCVSEIPVEFHLTNKIILASEYAFDLVNDSSATCTFSFRVPPGPGATFTLTPLTGESILLDHGAGWNASVISNALTHAVSFTSRNAYGYTLSQLYRCEILGGTNTYFPCFIAIGCQPALNYPYALKSSVAAQLIATNVPAIFSVSMDFSKLSSVQSNEFNHAFVPDIASNVLSTFKAVMDTNSATLFIGTPAKMSQSSIEFLDYLSYTNITNQVFGEGQNSDPDLYLSRLFASPYPVSSSVQTNSFLGNTLYSAYQHHLYTFSSYTSSSNLPVVLTNSYTFNVGSTESIYSNLVSSTYPSLWALSNGLVSRVRIYGIVDQSIDDHHNPYGVATNFSGSVFVSSDRAVESSNLYVNYCDYPLSNVVSQSHFPVGRPISSNTLTLFHDEIVTGIRTNYIQYAIPAPAITSRLIAPAVQSIIPQTYYGITNAMFYDHIVDHTEKVSLILRRIVVVVDWRYKYPELP